MEKRCDETDRFAWGDVEADVVDRLAEAGPPVVDRGVPVLLDQIEEPEASPTLAPFRAVYSSCQAANISCRSLTSISSSLSL